MPSEDPGSPVPGETDGAATVQDLLKRSEIRQILARPRHIPRTVRQEIAEVLADEIVAGGPHEIRDVGRFTDRMGAFYPILLALRSSEEWRRLVDLSRRSPAIPALVLKSVLPKILDVIEQFPTLESKLQTAVDKDLVEVLAEFKRILEETLQLWGRRLPSELPTETNDLRQHVERFQSLEGAQRFMQAAIRALVTPDLSSVLQKLEEAADLLETLSLLFPGRMWDYALSDLHLTFLADLDRYARILERSEEVRKMLTLMGRIELEYGSKRIAIAPFGSSEVHSVTKSKDVQRVLPVELVKLEDETLETLFFANWLEGNLLTYQLRGRHWVGGPPKKKRKGPVVALVDTSGSMDGSPEVVAKALVFAIVRRMLRDRRDVKVVMFSSVGETSEFELTSTNRMGKEFLEFLNYSFGGGTDFNTALKSGLDSLEKGKFRDADLLFITDGLSAMSDQELVGRWLRFKGDNDARIFTVIVGNDTAGGLERLSDQTYLLAEGANWAVESSPASIVELLAYAANQPNARRG